MIRILEPGENIDSTIEIVRRHGELESNGPVKGRPLKEVAEQHKGQRLIMYQSRPWVALHFSTLVLHALPTQGAEFGPASRDVGKPGWVNEVHGRAVGQVGLIRAVR